ncbi:MAG: hypothetical protein J6A30_02050, partial [Ruminococcus sp.]|nr:hypothetical protein [Ruminococcus sp.]
MAIPAFCNILLYGNKKNGRVHILLYSIHAKERYSYRSFISIYRGTPFCRKVIPRTPFQRLKLKLKVFGKESEEKPF